MKLRIAILAAVFFACASAAHAQAPATYTAKCQMCHGATGMGDTPAGKAMGAVAFKSAKLIAASDAEITANIKAGKGKMPAFNGKLSDPEIAALVVYIRKLQK